MYIGLSCTVLYCTGNLVGKLWLMWAQLNSLYNHEIIGQRCDPTDVFSGSIDSNQ